jgi:hypothetical protein
MCFCLSLGNIIMKSKIAKLTFKNHHMKLIITLTTTFICLICIAIADSTTEQNKRRQLVQLPSMNFSPVISLAEGEITLLMTAEPIADLKHIAKGTPRLIVPRDVNDFYIVVSPDPNNSTLPLKMEIIILKETDHKMGETLWINKTKHQISANLGLIKMTLAPESQTISKDPIKESGYYRAEFTYQIDGEGDFKKITEQQWWHDTKTRHLGYVVDSGNILPSIMIFRDFRGN